MENSNFTENIQKGEVANKTISEIESLTKDKWDSYGLSEKENIRDNLFRGLAFCNQETIADSLNRLTSIGAIVDLKGALDKINTIKDCTVDKEINDSRDGFKKVYKAVFPGLVDIVVHEGEPTYLIKEKNEIVLKKEVVFGEECYVLPNWEKIPWKLPQANKIKEYYYNDSDELLFKDLVEYHSKASCLTPGHYILIACWDLHTYMLESVKYSPIILLFAVPERGKTRTGTGMINVAYRGISTITLRESYIFRIQDNCMTSIFFDVIDIWKKMERGESEDVVCERYEKGKKVARVNNPERGSFNDITYYNTFGPTIVATNKKPPEVLESRSILINMPLSNKKLGDLDTQLAISLKERLVAFRARHLNEPLKEIERQFHGRLGDISKPLIQILEMVKPDYTGKLLKVLSDIEEKRKLGKSDTVDARLIEVIAELSETESIIKGVISVTDITNKYNEKHADRLNDRFKISTARVGKLLDAMHFKKCRVGNGRMGILVDLETIKRFLEEYGLTNPSEPSETSEPVSEINESEGS